MSRTPIRSSAARCLEAFHAAMLLATVVMILGGFAKAEGATQAFAIPAQPLGDALAQFADETNSSWWRIRRWCRA